MVAELDITDQDVKKLADMIDNEIASLVPEWKRGTRIEESSQCESASFCLNCATNGSLFGYASSDNPCAKNLQFFHCSKNGCAAIHGRFEEITYQVEGSENSATEGARDPSCQSNGIHYTDIWAQRDEPELSSEELKDIHCDNSHEVSNQSAIKDDGRTINVDDQSDHNARKPPSSPSSECFLLDYENEIRQELRWLKAKYQMQLRELNRQLGGKPKFTSIFPDTEKLEHGKDGVVKLSVASHMQLPNKKPLLWSMACGKQFPVDAEKCSTLADQMAQNADETSGSSSPEQMVTAKAFFAGPLLPHSLHRATSLPVDAVDV